MWDFIIVQIFYSSYVYSQSPNSITNELYWNKPFQVCNNSECRPTSHNPSPQCSRNFEINIYVPWILHCKVASICIKPILWYYQLNTWDCCLYMRTVLTSKILELAFAWCIHINFWLQKHLFCKQHFTIHLNSWWSVNCIKNHFDIRR